MINVGEDTDISNGAGLVLQADEFLWIDDGHFDGVAIFSWFGPEIGICSRSDIECRFFGTVTQWRVHSLQFISLSAVKSLP